MVDYLLRGFPKLKRSSFRITSPATTDYNCVAWALGDDKYRWDPDPFGIYRWPTNLERRLDLKIFIGLFRKFGYKCCSITKQEKGYEKIAIFSNSQGIPTHVARQLASGLWTSKLGDEEDIEHNLEDLTGFTYGKVAQIMKRSFKS